MAERYEAGTTLPVPDDVSMTVVEFDEASETYTVEWMQDGRKWSLSGVPASVLQRAPLN